MLSLYSSAGLELARPLATSWRELLLRGRHMLAAAGRARTLSDAASKDVGRQMPSLYIADAGGAASGTAIDRKALLLGLMNYFERHLPSVGFFQPISTAPYASSSTGVSSNVELLHQVFGWQGDARNMIGMLDTDANKLIATGKTNDLLDQIYSAYSAYKEHHSFVLIEGPNAGTDIDASLAAALGSPVLLTISGKPRMSINEYYNLAMMKRQVFRDHKVDVLGVALTHVPRADHALICSQLKQRFEKDGLAFAGGIPEDPLLSSVRLDEVKALLGAEVLFSQGGQGGPGSAATDPQLDQEYTSVMVASQRIEELLELLEDAGNERPLVVTSMDRLDIVLGLLASQLSVHGPTVAGILLTQAGKDRPNRAYSKEVTGRIFKGLSGGSLYKGSLLPVLGCNRPLYDVSIDLDSVEPSILPTSARKISQSKLLFDRHIDANALVTGLQKPQVHRMSPKMFQYNIKAMCTANPQHIVLPESVDKRVLAAASEVTLRGLAKVTLLGDPQVVSNEAKKLGLDISLCKILDPAHSERLEQYADLLVEARKGKGLTRQAAQETLSADVNAFGVMMVAANDADGMVSGAIHTTAATIRPAMQVLKTGGKMLVSSVFFMCLPDKVLVYGDCAVNVNPSSEDLAQIAITSADTAKAFGIEPRVAMLSYSTLGSGAGPDVQKVTDAVAKARALRPDLKVEGPIQYDAAIDPTVAAVKIKGNSEVAGKATVFIFPDLNTGNNTYKAVQQATGAVAMGPIMQGLGKPVNDLSRGCTVADIVNTVCVTSLQALQIKRTQASKAGGAAAAAAAEAARIAALAPQ